METSPDPSRVSRGGPDSERLFLADDDFALPDGRAVHVRRTDLPIGEKAMLDLIARHRGRYSAIGLFCRPGYRLLDFPCGSGYAAELLEDFGIDYDGRDVDPITIDFARRTYGRERVSFETGDLCAPRIGAEQYELIACVEGLEHIDQEFQEPLVTAIFQALKTGGTALITSPEATSQRSGRSSHNPFHRWELTRRDFLGLVGRVFGDANVELVTHRALLSTGVMTTCLFAFCHKRGMLTCTDAVS